MVASTVYNFQQDLDQICGVLSAFGYEVWNSHIGTIRVDPRRSNLENCVAATAACDLFLGIIRPFYGTGVIGPRSITHEEIREAVRLGKPRWFLVHRDVTFTRQLLKSHLFTKRGKRTKFTIGRTPVMDDLRVIEMYDDAIQSDVAVADRVGNWAQEFLRVEDALRFLDSQFKDVERIRAICPRTTK
ncbi:MAG: DUF4062 domain-containing protein [Candidatus Binatia bacterium]